MRTQSDLADRHREPRATAKRGRMLSSVTQDAGDEGLSLDERTDVCNRGMKTLSTHVSNTERKDSLRGFQTQKQPQDQTLDKKTYK